jgi:hypothetical protein
VTGRGNTSFKVNFTNAPFIGKSVVKLSPKLVSFPNNLFNVIRGINAVVEVKAKIGLVEHKATFPFPNGYYTRDDWVNKYNSQVVSQLRLNVTEDTEGRLTLAMSSPTLGPNDFFELSSTSNEEAQGIFDLLGIEANNFTDEGIIAFKMHTDKPPSKQSPQQFAWNDTVLLNCNVTQSNSVNSNPTIRLGNVLDVISINSELPRNDLVTLYHEDEDLSAFYLCKGDSIQDLQFSLHDKHGRPQLTYEKFDFSVILKIYYY